jgi:hypothetical protein
LNKDNYDEPCDFRVLHLQTNPDVLVDLVEMSSNFAVLEKGENYHFCRCAMVPLSLFYTIMTD